MSWLREKTDIIGMMGLGGKPSTGSLRANLFKLLEQESNERYARSLATTTGPERFSRIARMKINAAVSLRYINDYSRETLLAVTEAAKEPAYSLIYTMDRGDEAATLNVALFFTTFRQLELNENQWPLLLLNFSKMTSAPSVKTLYQSSPEGAKALLRLSHHVLNVKHDVEPEDIINPELLKLVMTHPEQTDDIIAFLDQRNDLSVSTLHPQFFLDSMKSEAQSLRDGIL